MTDDGDRFALSREFALQRFEMDVMKTTDLYTLQVLAIKLYSQTISQRHVYERLLRDSLPRI